MSELNDELDKLLKSMNETTTNIGVLAIQSQLIAIHSTVAKNNNINHELLKEISVRFVDILEIIKKYYGGEIGGN